MSLPPSEIGRHVVKKVKFYTESLTLRAVVVRVGFGALLIIAGGSNSARASLGPI